MARQPGEAGFPLKVELHVHMDGAARHQTILEVAATRGLIPHCKTIQDLKQEIVMSKPSTLERLLHCFATFTPVFAGNRDAVYRLAYEFCEDCSLQGIKYVEPRFSPHLLANTFEKPVYAPEPGNFSPHDVVTTVSEALKQGAQDFNIKVKAILCCIRHFPEWSLEVAGLCREFRDSVVAIDVAGPEFLSGMDPTQCPHKLAFKEVEIAGLHRTAHASEVRSSEMMYEALDEYNAERIGHGYHSLDCDKMYQRVLKERVHLETCPISSIITGGAPNGKVNHPILRFAEDKANFSLNTDDPTVLDNTLTDDYITARGFGLSNDQITQSIFNAARSSFLPDGEKKLLVSELVAVYGDQW
ncbi:adenosine deaminase-like [Haliotis rubra]|uniref:adenosine deaminase-like n=1 Tax=Haliotis rubra TaxID=36100 RepID=UPI001EE631DF|nr:adenosine deaminase-like [Haliotis rubra]